MQFRIPIATYAVRNLKVGIRILREAICIELIWMMLFYIVISSWSREKENNIRTCLTS